MTEIEALHSRIFHENAGIREEVTPDEIKRYSRLVREKEQKDAERNQILAEARELGRREKTGVGRPLRGARLIAQALRGA